MLKTNIESYRVKKYRNNACFHDVNIDVYGATNGCIIRYLYMCSPLKVQVYKVPWRSISVRKV